MKDIYSDNAGYYFEQYQKLDFNDVHGSWLKHLPEPNGLALDIGAGSGRDAAALAKRGWDVLAVEPAAGLREKGEAFTAGLSVQWMDDSLPALNKVRKLGFKVSLILVSAVWMYLPEQEQERAFRILTELLSPGGLLVITLRHGPSSDERIFYPVDPQQIKCWACHRSLTHLLTVQNDDLLQRPLVSWETLAFTLPDDGTGALSLLRHVIVNDNKSSTYKLGLLRALASIAEYMPGIVMGRTDEWVDIPLGAVGLYWIKLYKPLILEHDLRQAPGNRGYGFNKDAFKALSDVSGLDMRIGQPLDNALAKELMNAIRDAVSTIKGMPVKHIFWPGSGGERPVFHVRRKTVTLMPPPKRLDKETLARFGYFRVPMALWNCFSQHNCWIDPAIVNEWVQLMRGYVPTHDIGHLYQTLFQQEAKRDTSLLRKCVTEKQRENHPVECVWTGRRLTRKSTYCIDHCLPWARWSNNDLWNLLPTTQQANADKSDKLPSQALMEQARERIITWWEIAFMGSSLEKQFYTEARTSLPMLKGDDTLENVFEALMLQRLRLKANQQLTEWQGMKEKKR
ncbi:methyltransferase domain-containing protein [Larsenimonas rhizosphaerae]|uniref:Methyltransferase domain-containing protein n=1 Tax=Larsenimonas rhizosphaerae TaxID=2944682 RepID=A0AA41ZQ80_9GAMM|nr:methyltransferase domain-containing protein [Larsenimonas rhizosphaerae]MCX2525300.1 methyltransferase domain-containing protein [Larsenimonas rhizosphaerae]